MSDLAGSVDARNLNDAPPLNRRRKVLFFIYSLSCGGAERVTVNLANHWAAQGWRIHIVTMCAADTDFYALHPTINRIALNVAVESNNAALGMLQNLRRLKALRQVLREMKPDIALSMMWTANILLAIAASGMPDLKTIGSERNHPPRVAISFVWRQLRRFCYAQLSCLVSLTSESADWLVAHTHLRRSHIIPNVASWPIRPVAPILPVDAVCRPHRRILLAVGRLEPQKGLDCLIQAFEFLASNHPDWDLVILGEGRERWSLATRVKGANLEQRVFLPGQAGNVGEWYERADLYVLPSQFEGFPNTLAEAMAHGLPAVAFDCDTGPRDIIRHETDGLLVVPSDQAGLRSALDRLMTDAGLRERFAARAIEARQRFSSERIVPMWEHLFEEVVESRTR